MEKPNARDYESSQYTVVLDLPGGPGEEVEGAVVTRERPFALQQLKHAIMGEDGTDPEQYQIDWSVQNEKRYWKGDQPPMAQMFGSVKTGRWYPFSSPIPLIPKTSLYVRVINRYAAEGDTRKIMISFEGLEKKNQVEGA